MYMSTHRKEILRHLTSTDRVNVYVFGKVFAVTDYFWDPIFYANVNVLARLRMLNDFGFPQLANHFNNQC